MTYNELYALSVKLRREAEIAKSIGKYTGELCDVAIEAANVFDQFIREAQRAYMATADQDRAPLHRKAAGPPAEFGGTTDV